VPVRLLQCCQWRCAARKIIADIVISICAHLLLRTAVKMSKTKIAGTSPQRPRESLLGFSQIRWESSEILGIFNYCHFMLQMWKMYSVFWTFKNSWLHCWKEPYWSTQSFINTDSTNSVRHWQNSLCALMVGLWRSVQAELDTGCTMHDWHQPDPPCKHSFEEQSLIWCSSKERWTSLTSVSS